MSSSSALRHVDDGLAERLSRICEVSQSSSVLARHGKDESYHECVPPELVAFPESTAEVSAVVRECAAARTAIVPYGTGTSLEGHVQAPEGGVCVDLGAKMTRIVDESVEDQAATCEAGVTRGALNRSLRSSGLEFAVDPGADASLGGMAACGASGTRAVSIGTMRENVTGLQVVLPDGRVADCGGKFRKSSAGYDLVRLFVGSEGTLGVLTECTVKLSPRPAFLASAVITFASVRLAGEAVVTLLASGVPLKRCELLDATTVNAFNRYNRDNDNPALPERATLFLELGDAALAVLDAHLALAKEICEFVDPDAAVASSLNDEAAAADLWKARHSTYYAALALKKPDGRAIVTDVCVPLSKFADMVEASVRFVDEYDVVGPTFGHAGDGNIHTILCYNDHDDQPYLDRLHACHHRIVDRALALGGTISGEHGVGAGKRAYLRRQYGDATIDTMATIKAAIDPLGIMNPRKIL